MGQDIILNCSDSAAIEVDSLRATITETLINDGAFWKSIEERVKKLEDEIKAKYLEENPGEVAQRFFRRSESVSHIAQVFGVEVSRVESILRVAARREFRQR